MPKTIESGPFLSELQASGSEPGFVVIEDVPVFDEHVADDGTVYDADALESIAGNLNARITDGVAGNYVNLVDRHTVTEDEEADYIKRHGIEPPQPKWLGYAGPFKVGFTKGRDPKAVILATFRLFDKYADYALNRPHRSVEVWLEEDVHDRYFEPIALLPADTAPRRDLGLLYSRYSRRTHKPVKVARYSATVPAGANVFVPGEIGQDKKRHEKGSGNMTDEDLAQIVGAFKQLPEMKYLEKLMQEEEANTRNNKDDEQAERMRRYMEENHEPMMQYMDEGDDDAALEHYMSMEDEDKEIFQQMADEDDMERYMSGSPKAMWAQVEDADGWRKKGGGYAKGRMKGNWHTQMSKYSADGMDDEEAVDRLKKEKARYNELSEMASYVNKSEGNAEGLKTQPHSKGRYSKLTAEVDRYRKDNTKLNAKVARLSRRLSELETEKNLETKQRVRQERYAKLVEKSYQVKLDPDEEIEHVADMDDSQWERQLTSYDRYEKIPVGMRLPGAGGGPVPAPPMGTNMNQRVAKADAAAALAQREGLPFADAMRRIESNA